VPDSVCLYNATHARKGVVAVSQAFIVYFYVVYLLYVLTYLTCSDGSRPRINASGWRALSRRGFSGDQRAVGRSSLRNARLGGSIALPQTPRSGGTVPCGVQGATNAMRRILFHALPSTSGEPPPRNCASSLRTRPLNHEGEIGKTQRLTSNACRWRRASVEGSRYGWFTSAS
jgi:hypothetical protein